ncbi:MAG: biliverdin-producing heme oxygenase [Pseudomonadota bacterium]
MNQNNIIEHLRAETESLHRQVEQLPDMAQLMSPTVTDNDYLVELLRLRGLFSALEPMLLEHFNDLNHGDYCYLSRLDALDEDINCLNGSSPLESKSPITLGYHQAIGAAYVVEGATMGGKILAQRLSRTLNRNKANGLQFFNFHRKGTRSLFVSWLQQLEFEAQQVTWVTQGATTSFRLLLNGRNEEL